MTAVPARELLESAHTFPGPYAVKAFGPHSQEFVDAVVEVATRHHDGDAPPGVSARASARGTHLCVTVTILAPDADAVIALYASVGDVAGLRMLL
ncbi:MAG: DUF493 family protein [Myxococcales bacterium]|nr:DUF493 family protein [Myxococcales bacterium]MCB9531712.1 DUF493 family protein [Myxococcales bacterium]